MDLPIFYSENTGNAHALIGLDEGNSRHVTQVLRMKSGDSLLLTDGKGNLLTCSIVEEHKKKTIVQVKESRHKMQGTRKISIAISLLKNPHRFEWFLEKATELGINEIFPLIAQRTGKLNFRFSRMQNILVSAMLQSQQLWLPALKAPAGIKEILDASHQSQKFIAHCAEGTKVDLAEAIYGTTASQIILIGPEGDFTKEEIDLALKHHFVPVTLGETRLRTETAGLVAATLLTR